MSAEPNEDTAKPARSTERIVFFTDAVVAIAMTLLVLPLADLVPDLVAEHGTAIEAITQNQDKVWSFVLSFAVIARLWFAHHRLFEQVRAYNGLLVEFNFCWLFTITVLPFTTEITGNFGADRFAVLLYVGTIAASTASHSAMVLVIRRHPELAISPITNPQLANSAATTGALVIAVIVAAVWPAAGYYALLLLLLSPLIVRWVK